MKRTDIILAILVVALISFFFRYQITGLVFGYDIITLMESGGMGGFHDTGDNICTENGTPIVYFFGSSSCGHCAWEKPIFNSVVSEFEGYISVHENIDNNEDESIRVKYSDGVPSIIIGCKFVRNGSGENLGEELEKVVLRKLICEVSNAPSCG